MAAPTLTINASGQLEIAAGTSGDPVTWNDVWDWDDGGGSSAGDGDIPIDGGGTAKVSAYMTETVADAVYLILDDITFGDGTAASYFQSENEMVRFADDKNFAITTNATLELGDKTGDWGVDGSYWSVSPAAAWSLIPTGQTGTFYMYTSTLDIRANYQCNLYSGNVDIISSIIKYRDKTWNIADFRFQSNLLTLNLKNVFCNSLKDLGINKTPDSISGVHVHDTADGIVAIAAITIIGSLSTSIVTSDYSVFITITLTVKNPQAPIANPAITISGSIIEQYTCNIHCTDKDGADLQSVDVDCEYAHLVEGSDSKTYKCIQDHTSVDATHKPITGNAWGDFWELYDAGGGFGGDWQTTFDFKAGTQEFAQDTTDADGDISEQVIQYKKWEGSSELLEARIHKFTFSHASYPDITIEDVIVSIPLVWRIDMGQSTSDLEAIRDGATYVGTDDKVLISTDAQDLSTTLDVNAKLVNSITPASTADLYTQSNSALVANKLDHLVAVADSDDPVDDSIVAKLATRNGNWSNFDDTEHSLEALKILSSAVPTVAQTPRLED